MDKTQSRFSHGLSLFGDNGGVSQEQGNFYDATKVAQASIPLLGKAPTPTQAGLGAKLSTSSSGILKALFAIFQGNQRKEVGLGKMPVFPMNSSEARYPQKVPKVRK